MISMASMHHRLPPCHCHILLVGHVGVCSGGGGRSVGSDGAVAIGEFVGAVGGIANLFGKSRDVVEEFGEIEAVGKSAREQRSED